MRNQAQIYDALALLSVVLNQPQDTKRLQFYAEALKDFEVERVVGLIQSLSRTTKFFPQLVEIIEPLKGLDAPTEETATIIASEIIECISRFGPYQTNEVKQYLGEKFQVIDRIGGWQSLCQITNGEVASTRAQLRELAKAYINRSRREVRSIDGGDFRLSTESRSVESNASGLKLVRFSHE